MQPTQAAGQLQVLVLLLGACQAPSATTATSATINPHQRSLKATSKQQQQLLRQQEAGSSSSSVS